MLPPEPSPGPASPPVRKVAAEPPVAIGEPVPFSLPVFTSEKGTGDVAGQGRWVVNLAVPATLHEMYGQELAELLDTVLAGEVVTDRDIAERLVRSIGALEHLHQRHRLDTHGRCAVCRPRRRWCPWPPKRSTCTVHAALSFFLQQPGKSTQ